MTRMEFYTARDADAYRTAVNICKSRRERAGIPGLDAADVDLEHSMILREWYEDYRRERV